MARLASHPPDLTPPTPESDTGGYADAYMAVDAHAQAEPSAGTDASAGANADPFMVSGATLQQTQHHHP